MNKNKVEIFNKISVVLINHILNGYIKKEISKKISS